MKATLYILLFFSSSLHAQFMLLADGPTPQPPAFSDPSDVSGLYAWYVASDMDGDGIENEESGTADATWTDKSGNGYNMSRNSSPTISTRNGYNVVSFDGVDDRYQAGAAADWAFLHDGGESTIFWVGQIGFTADPNILAGVMSTGTVSSSVLGYGIWYEDRASVSNNDALRVFVTQGIGSNRVVSDVTAGRAQNTWTANTYNYIRVEVDCSQDPVDMADYWINSTFYQFNNVENRLAGSGAPANPFTVMAMGDGGFPCPGEVAEIIIYNRKLTAQEISDVEGYIATKYNL